MPWAPERRESEAHEADGLPDSRHRMAEPVRGAVALASLDDGLQGRGSGGLLLHDLRRSAVRNLEPAGRVQDRIIGNLDWAAEEPVRVGGRERLDVDRRHERWRGSAGA